MALAHILAGKQKKLYLGNLDAMRDWGYAPDYVEAIWEMLQREEPEDFVIGTGEAHTVREFVEEAFGYVGLDWREYVQIDPRYFRPVEVVSLLADTRKARERLGWEPKVTFRELVRIMVDADMEASGLTPPGEGTAVLERKFGTWHRWDNSIENR
jgi:GDPmannose 4,6-dehydratase